LCLEKPFELTTLKEMVLKLLREARNIHSAALGLERRRPLRVSMEFSVTCLPVAGAATSALAPRRGEALNVSRERVFLALDAPVQPFTLLAIQVVLRNAQMPLRMVGESRWRREARDRHGHQVGLAFRDTAAGQ
jgi:hypothetical protein